MQAPVGILRLSVRSRRPPDRAGRPSAATSARTSAARRRPCWPPARPRRAADLRAGRVRGRAQQVTTLTASWSETALGNARRPRRARAVQVPITPAASLAALGSRARTAAREARLGHPDPQERQALADALPAVGKIALEVRPGRSTQGRLGRRLACASPSRASAGSSAPIAARGRRPAVDARRMVGLRHGGSLAHRAETAPGACPPGHGARARAPVGWRHGQETADPAPPPRLPAQRARPRSAPGPPRARGVADGGTAWSRPVPEGRRFPRSLGAAAICHPRGRAAPRVLRQSGRADAGHRRRAGDLRRVRRARPRGRAGLRRARAARSTSRAPRAPTGRQGPYVGHDGLRRLLRRRRGRLAGARDPRGGLPRHPGLGDRDGPRRGPRRRGPVPARLRVDMAARRAAARGICASPTSGALSARRRRVDAHAALRPLRPSRAARGRGLRAADRRARQHALRGLLDVRRRRACRCGCSTGSSASARRATASATTRRRRASTSPPTGTGPTRSPGARRS